jgi:hypothetical protein
MAVKGKKRDQVSRRELWYKIKISRFSLTIGLTLTVASLVIVGLIYFDQIAAVIEWRISKLDREIAAMIDQSRTFNASAEEIANYHQRLTVVRESRVKDQLDRLAYREKLLELKEDVQQFLGNLESIQRGYIAQIVKIIKTVSVSIQENLSWETATSGMRLTSGDKVKTGVYSLAEISTESGNLLRVNPESMIIVKDLGRDRKTFMPREVFSISESENADFNIRTRRADIILEAESAMINVRKESDVKVNKQDRNATISVYAGTVEIRNNVGETKEIHTREAISISKQGLFQEMEKIPYPPELLEPINLNFFRFGNENEVSVTLRWSRQEEINQYRFQVATDMDFNNKVKDEVINGFTFTLTKLGKGNYFWRVASMGKTKAEIQSEFTATRSFLISFSKDEGNSDITPPQFEHLTVKKISQQAVLIEGKTEPGARLVVGPVTVTVKDDGTFSDIVPVESATTRSIELHLFDNAGNVNRKTVRIY